MTPAHGDTLVFGVKLQSLAAPSIIGVADDRFSQTQPIAHAAANALRCGRLLRALLAFGNEGVTVDLRLCAHPNAGQPSRGTVSVAILVRLDDVNSAYAARCARELHDIVRTTFPESDWNIIASREIPNVLGPFDIRSIARISRRKQLIGSGCPTDRDQLRHVSGFVTPAHATRDGDDSGVVFVAPFVPAVGSVDALLRLLLAGENAVALSIRLRQVALKDVERNQLDAAVANARSLSEWAASQVDSGTSWSMLRELTAAAALHLADRRVALEAGAIAVTIELASSADIPPTVVAVTADLFTAPPGWHDHSPVGPLRLLSGGYAMTFPSDLRAASADFQTLNIRDIEAPGSSRDWFSLPEAERLIVLPPTPQVDLPGIPVRSWRRVPPPSHASASGSVIGVSDDGEVEREVRFAWNDRLRHQHVVGQTGTGKSNLLLHQILADINAGHGVGLLDPHGDLLHDVLDRIPAAREKDIILIDPTDDQSIATLNPLAVQSDRTAHRIAEGMLSAIQRLVTDRNGSGAREWMGPIFEQHVRMNLLLLMSDANRPASLFDFYQLFQIPDYYKRWLPLRTDDPLLKSWVESVLPNTDYQRQGSEGTSMGAYIGSKFQQFAFDPQLRCLFSKRDTSIDFGEVLTRRKILLVNLSRGELGASNSEFTGMVILVMLMAAVFERVHTLQSARAPFFLHIDEFQNMLTGALVPLLSEGRKYGIGLTLAHQYAGQVEPRILDAILGNVGTHVSFRCGIRDAEQVEACFLPTFNARDIANLPNYHMCVANTVDGHAVSQFSARTLPPPPPLRKVGGKQRTQPAETSGRAQSGDDAAANAP